MRQFFIDGDILAHLRGKGDVELTGKDFHHLARVLRAVAGDRVLLVDSAGHRFDSRVVSVEADAAILRIEKTLADPGPQPRLRLCIAPPRGKAWDQVLDAAAQVGAQEIWPVMTRRVVVRWDKTDWAVKSGRFQRILAEAAAQCNRPAAPALADPMDLKTALHQSGDAVQLLAWEESGKASLDLLDTQNLKESWINVWIGPEGGFEPSEAQALQDLGAVHFSLGQGLLRVPVAVAASLSLVWAAWDRQMRRT